MELFNLLWANRWDVFLFIGLVLYRKEIFKALAGGNGQLQVDELAKGLILLVFYLSFEKESSRTDLAHNIFPESYWYALIGGVFLIAGVNLYKHLKKKTDEV